MSRSLTFRGSYREELAFWVCCNYAYCLYLQAFLLFTYGAVGASRKIHQKLVDSVLSTTLRFLDKTPTGRIVARFTRDVRAVDGPLADDLEAVCEITAAAVLKLAAIVYFTPLFLWPGLAFGIKSYILGTIYIAAQLSVKR